MAVLDLDLNPPPRALCVFGIAAAIVFGAGGAFAWNAGWIGAPLAYAAFGIAAVSALAALVWPAANRPLYVLLSILAWPIGLVLSYVMLGALFFLVLTPVGLAFQILRRDALRLRVPRSSATYWVPYERRGTLERYFRQF